MNFCLKSTGAAIDFTIETRMRAMMLEKIGAPLVFREIPRPTLKPGQVLVRISACAVCRTDLHVVDGELPNPKLPLIPGHEIIGRVEALGESADRFNPGARVGIPWVADARFCFPIPDAFDDTSAAPLLCAGLIGYRALRKTGDAHRLGLYGFGAAAHIIAQVARFQGRQVFAFTRPGDFARREFARKLGAVWAGGSDETPPVELDAAIIFAPAGALVPVALRAVSKGGTVVCGGIHMSDIPSFPYRDLWEERVICSVANLTRRDGEEFLDIAARIPLQTATQTFALEQANEALRQLRNGDLMGAAVLTIS